MRFFDFDLFDHVRRHNGKHRIRRVAHLLLAIPFWWLSYSIIVVLVAIPLSIVGAPAIMYGILTWTMMGLLVFDGFRRAHVLSMADRYLYSGYHHGLTGTQEEKNMWFAFARVHGVPDPFGLSFVISEILFSAPRALVHAWKSHRSIVRSSNDEIEAAQDLFDELLLQRCWLPVAEYSSRAVGLAILQKSGILWNRVDGGELEIRISAPLTNRIYSAEEQGS